MSRLAKKPLAIPEKVEITIDGSLVSVKGPKGDLSRDFDMKVIGIEKTDEGIVVTQKQTGTFGDSLLGTYASHVRNMLEGVTNGFEKKLILDGVGFRVATTGKTLDMSLGFSHPVSVDVPEELTVTVEKNSVLVQGINKELVGSFTAMVRALKKPEPYKGKGFRYHDEIILRKQGKRAA